MRFQGTVYRAINPRWARQPLSGDGAKQHGGRFNPKGQPALYTSLSIMTAIRESNQVGTLQPTTLVSYQADMEPVLDGRLTDQLSAFDIRPTELADPTWRDAMAKHGTAKAQRFALQLIHDGYVGLLVPSYARGAGNNDINLVIWRWGPNPPTQLLINDC